MRFEWRNKGGDTDALIAVDEGSNTVQEAWEATAPLLQDFLNDMTALGSQNGGGNVDVDELDPDAWGDMVIIRAEDGQVLEVDPELYWGRLAFWFRSRGSDPHPWRGRR